MTSICGNRRWGSQSSEQKVVINDIAEVDDFDEVFDKADALGVDLEGLDELDDMKERLLMHIRKDEIGNERKLILNSMNDCHKDDSSKRHKLNEVLSECQDKLNEFDVPETGGRRRGSSAIEDLLKTEGTANNFKLEFNERIKSIGSGECAIVISGETSAGKSRALNLLLGMPLLPVHHNSCTSVITRISYAATYRSLVMYRDGTRKVFSDQSRIKEELWGMIYESDESGRNNVSEIQEVCIEIPCPILKCGIVLVDSPGIGENDTMDNIIADFVEENEIMGFMYVIKSDNAGGVDEDRLLSLIKLVLEKQKKKSTDGISSFDPSCAVFVLNRWDLVKIEDQERIYDNAFSKLSNCWPQLEEKQVIRLSTQRAEQELNISSDYITEQFRTLLERIRDIFMRATQSRVHATYRWLERLLIRSVHHLKTLVKGLDSSERNLEDHMKNIHDKLRTLKEKSEVVLRDLTLDVNEQYEELCNDFREYLRQPGARVSITQWISSEAPKCPGNLPWEVMKEEIDDRISTRITEHLIDWDNSNGRIKAIQDMVVNQIKVQLRFLQNEVDALEDEVENEVDENGPELSPVSPISQSISASRRCTLTNFSKPERRRETITAMSPSFQQLLSSNARGDFDVPTKLAARIAQPVSKFIRKSAKLMQNDKNRINAYNSNPCKILKERSDKMLKKLVKPSQGDILQLYINALMNRPLLYLQFIEQNIPSLVQSNEDALNHVAHCRVDAKESRDLYERMMEALEALKHGLIQYGHGYIFVDDFQQDEIRLPDDQDRDSLKLGGTFRVSDIILNSSSCKEVNRRTLPRGLWTALQNAHLHKDENQEQRITIRVYLPSSGVEHTFPEVSKLRFIQHEHVAEFMGIHHSDSPTPAFVYCDHLKSVKRFLRSTLAAVDDMVANIICQTVKGLEYLHRKKMVHMELNINTITVSPDGEVKLSGACLPRHALFPMDKEKVEVGDFIYLSPEVLKGELYITCSDVYALGLVLLEIILNIEVFQTYRKWPLDRFTEKLDPKAMLDLDETLAGLDNTPISDLIRHCLDVKKDERPAMSRVSEILTDADSIIPYVVTPNKRKSRGVLKTFKHKSKQDFFKQDMLTEL